MKRLVNIILSALVLMACKCQESGTLIYYTQEEVDSIIDLKNSQIYDLIDENVALALEIKKFKSHAFDSIIRYNADTCYIYISDIFGNSVLVRKKGSQLNIISEKGNLRIASIWSSDRKVYLMDGATTKASVLERDNGYNINLVDIDLNLTKKK